MGYSIKQKIDICLMAEANAEMTQTDLALWAKSRFNSTKAPSQTTISRILAKKDELISLKEHEYKLIRRRRLTNTLLRKVLLEWITQCVWNNIPITAPIILSSASNFWKQLPDHLKDGTGEFSFKWCSQFLAKVNINLSTIDRDLYANRLRVWNFEERDYIKRLLANIPDSKIYTLGEVFISHDLHLDKSEYKDSSDILTCMLCTNVDGSDKMDPLIIGRYENYPSFESRSSVKASAKHGVSYHSNRKRWLTSTLFYDWLSIIDKRLALVNKDIVLILDDSASHRVVNIKLQRIRLLYTSSTSNSLPMDWGLEKAFRLSFRYEQFVELQRRQLKRREFTTSEEMEFTMSDTFDVIKTAWNSLPVSRIQSAWKQAGILPDSLTASFTRIKTFDNSLEVRLKRAIDQVVVGERWDVASLMDLSIEKKINKTFLSSEEIVDSCIVDNYDDFDHATGKALRAPFSHTLGQDLERLKRWSKVHQMYGQNNQQNASFEEHYWGLDFQDDLREHFQDDLPEEFQFDENIQDLDMLSPENTVIIPQLHDMSRLGPQAQWTGRSASTPVVNLSAYYLDPAQQSFLTPAQIISNEERLEIVQSFMNVINSDATLAVSRHTRIEVTELYQRLLAEMG